MAFEAIAEVTLAHPSGTLSPPSPPESFGFIITIGGESFSATVVPNGSGHLVPGKSAQICLRFLAPDAAAIAVHPGSAFSFFEQSRVGTGHVLSVRYA
jgi:hypothetical protein